MIGPLRYRSWLLLLATCVAVFGINLGGARALTSHEMDVGGGARQMVQDGDWLVIRFGDTPWLEKPPLMHWLAAGSITLFGLTTEWVVRLPSALAGTVVVCLVAMLVARWRSEPAGLVAGLVQCTSCYVITYGRLAEADMLLAAIVVGAIWMFVHLQGVGLPAPGGRARLLAVGFWSLIGLSNLVKGPLFGAAMVLIPCGAWLLVRRDAAAWRRLWSPLGLLAAAMIALPWPLLVISRLPGTLDLWWAHTFGRAAGDLGYGQPWWYYLTTPFWQLAPWTLATLIGAVPCLRRAWRDRDSADWFCWLWAVVPIVALSLSHGKHHHYIIHCLPAFMLVTLAGLSVIASDIVTRPIKSVIISRLLVILVAPALAIATVVMGLREGRAEVWVIGATVAAACLLFGVFSLRSQPRAAFTVVMAAIIISVGQVHLTLMPHRDTRRPDRDFLRSLHELVPPEATIVATGGNELARHIFYIQRPITGVFEPENIPARITPNETFFVVARMRDRHAFAQMGSISVLAQSPGSRREKSAEDRLTLFEVRPEGGVAPTVDSRSGGPQHPPAPGARRVAPLPRLPSPESG